MGSSLSNLRLRVTEDPSELPQTLAAMGHLPLPLSSLHAAATVTVEMGTLCLLSRTSISK